MRLFSISLLFSIAFALQAQQTPEGLPFDSIPAAPATYDANAMLARIVDGLGFRYRHATEDLRPEDLAYEPGNGGQSCRAVLEHLHGLSGVIYNSFAGQPNPRPRPAAPDRWEDLRAATLHNLKKASDLLHTAQGSPQDYDIIFQRGEKTSRFPVWNLINGPLTDAIYHVGQIVSYRRTAGNPVNPGINVFMGTVN